MATITFDHKMSKELRSLLDAKDLANKEKRREDGKKIRSMIRRKHAWYISEKSFNDSRSMRVYHAPSTTKKAKKAKKAKSK